MAEADAANVEEGTVRLQVAAARQEESGRGVVRMPRSAFQKLGITEGDPVEIEGKRATVAVAAPSYEEDELTPISWAVAISDDYDDAEPRVVLTVEEVGRPAEGLMTHLTPAVARRLRAAIHDALREVGEEPDA